MSSINRLYKKDNYTIQKSINLEDGLYTRLKELESEYDATISALVNVCVENLVAKDDIKYYAKPEGEILIYRSIMLRKENVDALTKINRERGISVTRLINISIKEFLDRYDKKSK